MQPPPTPTQGEDGTVRRDNSQRANIATAEITETNNLIFAGSLFNKGAFAVVGADLNPRLPGGEERLAGTEGLTLRLRGEGHTYACVLTTGGTDGGGGVLGARKPTLSICLPGSCTC